MTMMGSALSSDLLGSSSQGTRRYSSSLIPTKRRPNGKQTYSYFELSLTARISRLEVLGALVGHIPPNPLWAELIWQRQQELAKQPQHSHPNGASSGRDS